MTDEATEEASCDVCGGEIFWSENQNRYVHYEGAEEGDHDAVGPVRVSMEDIERDRDALARIPEPVPCPACGEPLDEEMFCNNPECANAKE